MNEPYDIIVTHKHVPNTIYVGRPSPLGNPFIMRSEEERDDVCDKYETWFAHKLETQDQQIMSLLKLLQAKGRREGYLRLGCHCAPKRCHADTIAAWLEKNQ